MIIGHLELLRISSIHHLTLWQRYGVDYIVGLAEKMRPNFLTYDYVVEEPGENKYDIIVGNPPYVEDFKSGLTLSKRYGNIYANVKR